MIRSIYRTHSGQIRTDLRPDEFTRALQDTQGLLWVDLVGEPRDVCAPVLRDIFDFHPLAVDDALEESHVPKVDDWGLYLYLVLHAVVFDPRNNQQLNTLELDLFLGQHYLVTYQFFDNPTPSVLENIFALKRALLHLRRIIAPQREALNKLTRGDYAVIDVEERVFFRDVYDHLVRLYDITKSLRDLLGSALDTYLSVVNNRMNEVMKTLTVITTLFMPISFLVGFFGTNFFQPVASLNVFTDQPAFVLFLAATVLLPAGMYMWMRRRAWM